MDSFKTFMFSFLCIEDYEEFLKNVQNKKKAKIPQTIQVDIHVGMRVT